MTINTWVGNYPSLPRQWEKVFGDAVNVVATSPEATEEGRADFEADFNKFLAQQRDLQESAMGRALTGENVYLKIRADGPSVEIPAAEVEMWHQSEVEHFPGCLCELCIGIRAGSPPCLVCSDGSVIPISEAEDRAFRRYAHREFTAADTEGSDTDHPIATERKTVAGHVADILSDLQFGKCTRGEAVEVESAAKRAIADHDVSRSIGKL